MRKTAGFTAAAILSLGIGIGANTTIFSFVNAVSLTPLPFPDADRLVILQEHSLKSREAVNVHPANFEEWRSRARSFEGLALVQAPPLNVMGPDGAEQISRLLTTPEVFRVFGVRPALGRGFVEEEGRPGTQGVVILGYGFWQRWFGADPSVVGRQLRVQDGSLTIVGVAASNFRIGLMEPDVFTPLTIDPANPSTTGSRAFQCYGRLKPNVTLDAARSEMDTLARALGRESRSSEGMGVFVSNLHEYLARDAKPGLRLLTAVAATTLAIACVNLAGLLLARGLARRNEFAVRAALGASRGRLVRQLLIEHLILSLCGGAAGLIVAYWATPFLVSLSGDALTANIAATVRLDGRCLFFTFAIAVVTALGFGLGPARQAGSAEPQSAIREGSRGATSGYRQQRARGLLVTAQLAAAIVLLVGAGLFLRTLSSLGRVDLGFDPAETLTLGLFLGARPAETRIAVLDQILDRVEAIEGVRAAGSIQFLPLKGTACGTGFWLDQQPGFGDPSRAFFTECALVSRGYLAAMKIPVLEGRPFDRRDRGGSPRVVMVSETFARRYFPGADVLGRRVLVQSSNQELATIIGIAGDVRHNGLRSDPAPTVYLLHSQTPGYITNLVVRTSGNPLIRIDAIRAAIHDVDPTQAISRPRLLTEDVASVVARPRLYATLVTAFAVIAVTLATFGIYGLLAYVVAQRSHEIGVRLALGASRHDVFLQLFRQGARMVIAGSLIGTATAFASRPLVSAMIFGITPGDPATYLLAAAVMMVVALAAVAIPARRGSRLDPTRALRAE